MKLTQTSLRNVGGLISLLFFLFLVSCGDNDSDDDPAVPTAEIIYKFSPLKVGQEIDPAGTAYTSFHRELGYWGSVTLAESPYLFWIEGTKLFCSIIDPSTQSESISNIISFTDVSVTLLAIMTENDNIVIYYREQQTGYDESMNVTIQRLVLDRNLKILDHSHFFTLERNNVLSIRYRYSFQKLDSCFLFIWQEEKYPDAELWGMRLSFDGFSLDPGGVLISEHLDQYGYNQCSFTSHGQSAIVLWLEVLEGASSPCQLKGCLFNSDGYVNGSDQIYYSSEGSLSALGSTIIDSISMVVWDEYIDSNNRGTIGIQLLKNGDVIGPGIVTIGGHSNKNQGFGIIRNGEHFNIFYRSNDELRCSIFDITAQILDDFYVLDMEVEVHRWELDNVYSVFEKNEQDYLLFRRYKTLELYTSYAYQFRMLAFPNQNHLANETILGNKPNSTYHGRLGQSTNQSIITWSDSRQLHLDWQDIYARRLNNDGTLLDSVDILLSKSDSNTTQLCGTQNTFLISMQKSIQYNVHRHYKQNEFLLVDEHLEKIERFSHPMIYMQDPFTLPSISCNNEKYLLVFQSYDSSSWDHIFGQWIYPDGSKSKTFLVYQHSEYYPYNVQNTSASTGSDFLVVYLDNNVIKGKTISQDGVLSDEINYCSSEHSVDTKLAGGSTTYLLVWLKLGTLKTLLLDKNGNIIQNIDIPSQSVKQHCVSFNGKYYLVMWREKRENKEKNIDQFMTCRILENGSIIDTKPQQLFSGADNLSLCRTPDGNFITSYKIPGDDDYYSATRVKTRLIYE